MMLRPIQVLFFFFNLLSLVVGQTLTNFTIDNTDSHIAYVGTWDPTLSHTSALDIGGSHTLSEDPNGSATLTFTGVAVYYLAPKWPYAVNSYIALDGGSPALVDMTAPPQDSPNGEETVAADVLWSATGLTNGNHQVVVTRGPAGYTVVDGFIYTTQSGESTSQLVSTVFSTVTSRRPASSTSGSSSQPSSTGSSESNQPNSTVIIAVTVSATAVSLILLVLLIIFFVRRKKKSDAADRYLSGFGPGDGGAAYTIPANNYPTATYSAVPLNDNQYTYPYGGATSHPNTGGQEMGMANMGARHSRYSTMAYSDMSGSASMGSLSAQQQMAHANAPTYGQDIYGMYPVQNRALVAPPANAEGGAAAPYNYGGGYDTTGYDYNGYNAGGAAGYSNGGASGYNAAAAYATSGLGVAAAGSSNLPPSPGSGKARFDRSNQQISQSSSDTQSIPHPYAGTSQSIPHPYAGTSEPPPYVDQGRPFGSSQHPIPASPPTKKKGFI